MLNGSAFRGEQSQLDRQARRESASPYNAQQRRRTSRPPPPATPSRLSGLVTTLFSPFRSAAKKVVPEPEVYEDSEGEDDQQDSSRLEEDDEQDQTTAELEDRKPIIDGEYYLDSRSVTREPYEEDYVAPPSPTPYTPQYPPASRSYAAPSPSTATPRFSGFTSNSRAPTQTPAPPSPQRVLDDLMEQRRRQGNPPLTPVQQDHIQRLMDAIRGEQVPTAFSPNFRPSYQPNSPAPSTSARASSIFAPPPNSNAGPSAGTPIRRRKPLYVGAGYSSQSARRRAKATEGLKRSQSDVGSYVAKEEEPEMGAVEGKRRRVEEEDSGYKRSSTMIDLASVASGSGSVTVPAPASATAKYINPPAPILKIAPMTTPARPSPLWQVSRADTPSPSPPRKQMAPAPTRPPTRAADLMLDIIRQEDAAQPVCHIPSQSHRIKKSSHFTFEQKVIPEAVLNPYDNADNVMARIPRSRPQRVAAPRKSLAAKVATPAKEISPLEQLEKSMPPEYRQESKRARPSPASESVASSTTPIAPVVPAPKAKQTAKGGPKKKKAVEVLELSDSDEDEEESDEATPPPPKAKATSRAFPPAPAPASAPSLSSSSRPFSAVRSSAPTSTSPKASSRLSTTSLSPVQAQQPPAIRASLPPSPAFSFTVTTPP
ncbi:hypothetical protein P7C70_g1588, partial [Phenoliferia sp. Uapishka_3]